MADGTCSADGCTRPTVARGLCTKHYQRLKRTGTTERRRLSPEERHQGQLDAKRRYRAGNRDRLSAERRARYWANRKQARDRMREWNDRNPGRNAANTRAWREANLEYVAEKNRQWYANNREWSAAKSARRRAQMRATQIGPVDLNEILLLYGMICHICGGEVADRGDLHFDHVVPLARGGTHTMDNIRPTHAKCNQRKGDRVIA